MPREGYESITLTDGIVRLLREIAEHSYPLYTSNSAIAREAIKRFHMHRTEIFGPSKVNTPEFVLWKREQERKKAKIVTA